MGYCETDDLIKALPEAELQRLTDDSEFGEVNLENLQEAIDSAGEEIDPYLGGRVALPITGTTPPILGKIVADIAIYNLYSRYRRSVPETWNERYKNAIRFLEKVNKGEISLGLQPPPDPPAEDNYSGGHRISARDKVFDETTMDKY